MMQNEGEQGEEGRIKTRVQEALSTTNADKTNYGNSSGIRNRVQAIKEIRVVERI